MKFKKKLYCNTYKILPGIRDSSKNLPAVPRLRPTVKMRFDLGQKAAKLTGTTGETGFLRLIADGLKSRVKSSSLTSLGDLFEDDREQVKLPMKIEASDILLTIVVSAFLLCLYSCSKLWFIWVSEYFSTIFLCQIIVQTKDV